MIVCPQPLLFLYPEIPDPSCPFNPLTFYLSCTFTCFCPNTLIWLNHLVPYKHNQSSSCCPLKLHFHSFSLLPLYPLCLTFLTPVMMSVLVLDGVLDLNFLFFNSLMAVSVTDSTPFIVTTSAVNTDKQASEKHATMQITVSYYQTYCYGSHHD